MAIIIWEQAMVYGAAFVLGIGISVLMSLIILPAFIFSEFSTITVTTLAFYVVQSLPAVRIVTPVGPIAAVLAGLVGICVLVLGTMTRVVTRPQIGQTLRLNED
jgi:hypothetical protein